MEKHFAQNTCLGVERLKKQNFHDPDSGLMETNLSLTLQGDSCVSIIGRAALRSPLQKNAESRDVLHEQLKRRPVPRSGTQNEPREKENEHTPTMNRQKCHCLALEQREANSTGNSARKKKPEHREASQHRTSHGTNSFNGKQHTPESWRECGVCLASHPTADLRR